MIEDQLWMGMSICARRSVAKGLRAKIDELDEIELGILRFHEAHLTRYKRLPHHTRAYIESQNADTE